jgi:hypothetical protein
VEILVVFNAETPESSLVMLQYKNRNKRHMPNLLKGPMEMKITKDDVVGTQHPVFVFFDVQRNNKKFEDLWSDAQKNRATQLKNILYELYGCRPRVFMNYRKDFIAIKIVSPKPAEKKLEAVQEFNKMLNNGNLVKEVDGGLVYEFRCV